jgi:predicted peroxiredoxin
VTKLAFVGTHGSENPTKACFPLLQAKNAIEAGMEAEISLIGDAVVLMRDDVANNIFPVGWPPVKELMAAVIEHKVPIYV